MIFRLSVLLCIFSINCFGQDSDEMLHEILLPDHISEEEAQILAALQENPLNINEADFSELNRIPFLTNIQIRNLLDYRNKYGYLISIYELQTVPGFDTQTIRNIAPFISFDTINPNNSLYQKNKIDDRLILNFETLAEKTEGYKNNRYLGNHYKINGRYRHKNATGFNLGLTFEKDPGEQVKFSRKDRLYGFDHYSGFIQKKFPKGCLEEFTVGDFTINTGQGLTLGMGFSFGKGSETIASAKKVSNGLNPFTSLAESGYFRGIGAIFTISPGLKFNPFISIRRVDATLLSKDTISGITESGYHRTQAELDKKNNTQLLDLGFSIQFSNLNNTFTGGYSMVYTQIEHIIAPKTNPHNHFQFIGSLNWCQGLYFEGLHNNLSYFGEAAISRSLGKGFVSGMILSLSKYIDVSVVFRDYEKNFHSLYSDAFSESTLAQNEIGIYQGIKLKPFRKLIISGYSDLYKFPWLTYGVSAPSNGRDYLIKTEYTFNKHSTCYIQYRYSQKEKDSRSESIPVIKIANFQQYSISIKSGNRFISFNSKAIFNLSHSEKGAALINDLNLKFEKHALAIRMALFDAENYATRVYSYEKDLLYSYSIPAYYGRGLRTSINLKITLYKNLILRTKIARFTYFNTLSTGTGDQKIEGNQKTDIKFQLYLRF